MNRRSFLAGLLAAPIAAVAIRLHLAPPPPVLPDIPIAGALPADWEMESELSYVVRRAFVTKLVQQLYNTSPLIAELLANAKTTGQ